MIARDVWSVLAAAAPGARVVLRLVDGTEIDVDRIEHFAGIVVVTACEDVTDETRDPDDRVEEFRDVLEEYDGLEPDQLRAWLESDEEEAMLDFLADQKVTNLDELRGRLALLPEPPPKPIVVPPLPTCIFCGKPTPSRDRICPECDDIPF